MLEKRDLAITQKISLLSNFADEAGRQGAQRLGKTLGLRVEIEETKVEAISRLEITSRYGQKDVMASATFTEVFGELPGTSFVLLQRDSALRIISEVTGAKPERPVSLSAFTPQIVLKRIGESLSITFFEGLAILLRRNAQPRLSAPEVIFDTWDNTLSSMTQQISIKGDNLFSFWLRFCCIIGNDRHEGIHLYFVDQELLKII
jgi:hypothetical protein